jgi:hypothetical protein
MPLPTNTERRLLADTCRLFIELNDCPLPLDLAFEATELGIDVLALENEMLNTHPSTTAHQGEQIE